MNLRVCMIFCYDMILCIENWQFVNCELAARGQFLLSRCWDKGWGVNELNFQLSFSRRAVKQNAVPIRLPNRRQPHAPRPLHAKEHAARSLAADQDSLGDLKGLGFELVLIANRLVDVTSEIAQSLDVERLGRHGLRRLLGAGSREGGKICRWGRSGRLGKVSALVAIGKLRGTI